MPIPITVDDFVAIGERYLSADIVNEADRLLPIATADIDLLATRGYGQGEDIRPDGPGRGYTADHAVGVLVPGR